MGVGVGSFHHPGGQILREKNLPRASLALSVLICQSVFTFISVTTAPQKGQEGGKQRGRQGGREGGKREVGRQGVWEGQGGRETGRQRGRQGGRHAGKA